MSTDKSIKVSRINPLQDTMTFLNSISKMSLLHLIFYIICMLLWTKATNSWLKVYVKASDQVSLLGLWAFAKVGDVLIDKTIDETKDPKRHFIGVANKKSIELHYRLTLSSGLTWFYYLPPIKCNPFFTHFSLSNDFYVPTSLLTQSISECNLPPDSFFSNPPVC